MKKVTFVTSIILAAFALAFLQMKCGKIPTTEELETYLEVTDIKTKWVEK